MIAIRMDSHFQLFMLRKQSASIPQQLQLTEASDKFCDRLCVCVCVCVFWRGGG